MIWMRFHLFIKWYNHNDYSAMQKQSIYSTYDFVSIFNVLKTCINTHLFFTRERIDMTERWMIRSFWDFVSTQTSSYFYTVILQVSRMGNLLLFGFLLFICSSFCHLFFLFLSQYFLVFSDVRFKNVFRDFYLIIYSSKYCTNSW